MRQKTVPEQKITVISQKMALFPKFFVSNQWPKDINLPPKLSNTAMSRVWAKAPWMDADLRGIWQSTSCNTLPESKQTNYSEKPFDVRHKTENFAHQSAANVIHKSTGLPPETICIKSQMPFERQVLFKHNRHQKYSQCINSIPTAAITVLCDECHAISLPKCPMW